MSKSCARKNIKPGMKTTSTICPRRLIIRRLMQINGIKAETDKIKRETILFGEGDVAKELRVVKTYVFETWYLACLP